MILPRLYQEYVGHDNNRDAYMLNTIESRVMEHTWRQWEPNIIYVHHQSSPFPTRIWLPPFAEPIATHAPGLMSSQLNMIGMAIAQRLNMEGKVGATHMGDGFDAWYPGYIDYNPVFKNIPAFWTETQGTGPSPRTSQPETVPGTCGAPQALYVSPWLGGTWRHARRGRVHGRPRRWRRSSTRRSTRTRCCTARYQSGRDQIARGRREAPYAYVVPQAQRDPAAAVEMLRRLAFSGVRVSQLTAPVDVRRRDVSGRHVGDSDRSGIRGARARSARRPQKYPEIRESPAVRSTRRTTPRAGRCRCRWACARSTATKPLGDDARAKMQPLGAAPRSGSRAGAVQHGRRRRTPRAFDSAPGIGFDSDPAAQAIVPPAGRITGTGPALAVNPAENNAFKAINRAWRAGASVRYEAGRRRRRWPLRDLRPHAGGAGRAGVGAGVARRTRRGAGREGRRVRASDCSSPTPAWTRAGRAGCSISTSSSTCACPAPTSRPAICATRSTCSCIADEARGFLEGGRRTRRKGRSGRRRPARGAAAPAARSAVAQRAARASASTSSCAAAARSSASIAAARSRSISSSCP